MKKFKLIAAATLIAAQFAASPAGAQPGPTSICGLDCAGNSYCLWVQSLLCNNGPQGFEAGAAPDLKTLRRD